MEEEEEEGGGREGGGNKAALELLRPYHGFTLRGIRRWKVTQSENIHVQLYVDGSELTHTYVDVS